MAFISVEDISNPSTSSIVGIFACSQNEPYPEGYIGKIDDLDPRISIFLQSQKDKISS